MAPAVSSILVTGASGFLGGQLRERLSAAGTDVRGLDFATDLKRGIVAGDISEPGIWETAFEGRDFVIHTAAVTSSAATREVAWRSNVLGTRNAVAAAIAAGSQRFIHISTARAYGDFDETGGVSETQPVRPDGSPYIDSKIAAEQVVLQAHAAGEIDCVILRPADIYGPGSRQWTVLPVDAIRGNRFVLPAMGRGIFSPLYVSNLLDAIELACESDSAPGQVFTISDGIGIPCREFFAHYSAMLGKGQPRVVPTMAAIGLAALPEAAAWVGGTNAEATRASMRFLARPGTYSIEKARDLLGYEPAIGLEQGMAETEIWLREHGLLR